MPRAPDSYRTYGRSRGNRLPRDNYIDELPVHVILGTFRGAPFFASSRLAGQIFPLLATHPRTLAACLMPDHAHWLVSGETGWPDDVRRLKSHTTQVAWRAGHRGRLWQRSYWDRVARSREDLLAVCEYLVTNPVRAGLVSSVEEYPYQVVRLRDRQL